MQCVCVCALHTHSPREGDEVSTTTGHCDIGWSRENWTGGMEAGNEGEREQGEEGREGRVKEGR